MMRRFKTTLFSSFLSVGILAGCQETQTSALPSGSGSVRISESPSAILVEGASYSAVFSKANGSLKELSAGGSKLSLANGGEGLWHARRLDRTDEDASGFSAQGPKLCSFRIEGGSVVFSYASPSVDAAVTVLPGVDSLDFKASVTPKASEIIEFAVPGRMTFLADEVDGVTTHVSNQRNVGMTLNANFFKDHSSDPDPLWNRGKGLKDEIYTALFGAPCPNLGDDKASVPMKTGPNGAEWLGKALAAKINGINVVAKRPFAKGQADIVIADTPNGVFFGASRLGGKGYFFRVGGWMERGNVSPLLDMVGAAVDRVVSEGSKSGRSKVALLRFKKAPDCGSGSTITVSEWAKRLKDGMNEYVEISSSAELASALKGKSFAAIVNPYGEMCPIPDGMEPAAFAVALKDFVKAGGSWFETEGYPFYYELEPSRYIALRDATVPSAFADFFHFGLKGRKLAVYSVQPFDWEPWAAAKDRSKMFTPSKFTIGGEAWGGFITRPFCPYIKKGEAWSSPTVRMLFGKDVIASAKAFCADNKVARKLSDKVSPELLAKLKMSPTYKYNMGTAKEDLANLGLVPSPAIIHSSSYLKGGFDKEYPDHVPPRAAYGTPEEFRAYVDGVRARGSLFMPYTNNTWWCDNPRGPTFIKEGEDALLIKLDGAKRHEIYGKADGWTITMWHPAVRRINDEVLRQFIQDYPSDMIFQDQCGAREWSYDLNQASPTPSAYIEGILSTVRTDAKRALLSTEDVWWGVLDSETQVCGNSFGLMEPRPSPNWRFLKEIYPTNSWSVFPLVEAMAHDKVLMTHHNLGGSVNTQEQLSWTLALGFTMINNVHKSNIEKPDFIEWLRWTDRIQKSVISEYVGVELSSFSHKWGDPKNPEDEGVIRTSYGPVSIVANFGPKPLKDAGREIAPEGFYAKGASFSAGSLSSIGGVAVPDGASFVVGADGSGTSAWLYGKAGALAAFPVPEGFASLKAKLEDGSEVKLEIKGQTASLKLPDGDASFKKLWKLKLSR